jgi:hypothetical protein
MSYPAVVHRAPTEEEIEAGFLRYAALLEKLGTPFKGKELVHHYATFSEGVRFALPKPRQSSFAEPEVKP